MKAATLFAGSSIVFGSHNVMGGSLGTRLRLPSGGIIQAVADHEETVVRVYSGE